MSIGERIRRARVMVGQSQRDLAEKAGVSVSAISKYEQDLNVPDLTVLVQLAQALGLKVAYFLRSINVTFSSPIYRRRESLPTEQEASIIERVREWLERYLDIEDLLEIPSHIKLPQQRIATLSDVEDAALYVREQWHLGLAPIEGLMEICEDHGIKVGLVDEHADFDALTLWANGDIPVIVLRRNMPGDQQRFCLAHELGHLVLEIEKDIDPEKAANRFAGAFLVPRPVVELELGAKRQAISLYEFHLLKHKYGLSMQGWIHRAKDLGILSETDATQMFKQFHQRNWYHEEPGDALPSEEPQRFTRLVMHALSEDIIGESRAAELLNVSVSLFIVGEVEEHGGLPINICG